MSSATTAPVDRRQRRRAETIEELVDVAVQVMGEQGVAGLSLGEVARRMGVRPPSLYVYFDSKNAVYDAVFARGWREVHEALTVFPEPSADADLPAYLLALTEVYVRWSVEHPVFAQLMGWRTVPAYEPASEAYQHARAAFARSRSLLAQLQDLGLFAADVEVDELMRGWTILSTGVVTQQLANAPSNSFEDGPFTHMLPQLVAMYVDHYSPNHRTPKPARSPRARRS